MYLLAVLNWLLTFYFLIADGLLSIHITSSMLVQMLAHAIRNVQEFCGKFWKFRANIGF